MTQSDEAVTEQWLELHESSGMITLDFLGADDLGDKDGTSVVIANKGGSGLYRSMYAEPHFRQLVKQLSLGGGNAQGSDGVLDLSLFLGAARLLQDAFEVRIRCTPWEFACSALLAVLCHASGTAL